MSVSAAVDDFIKVAYKKLLHKLRQNSTLYMTNKTEKTEKE
jgi:hypothetical protein